MWEQVRIERGTKYNNIFKNENILFTFLSKAFIGLENTFMRWLSPLKVVLEMTDKKAYFNLL